MTRAQFERLSKQVSGPTRVSSVPSIAFVIAVLRFKIAALAGALS